MQRSIPRTLRLLSLLPFLATPGFSAHGIGEIDPSFAPVPGLTGQAVQLASGKVLALGDYTDDGADGSGVTLERYNADGTHDDAFVAPFNEFNIGLRRFRVDSKGRILVAGGIPRGSGTGATFARLLESGKYDPGFNLTVEGMPTSFVVQKDDRFIFNGRPQTQIFGYTTVFTRVNTDGSPDTKYLTGSSTLSAVATDFALTADGKLVALGLITSYAPGVGFTNYLLVRLNADGSTDTSFHSPTASGDVVTFGTDKLAVQADGKLLISGITRTGDFSKTDAFMRRYNADGTLDDSFKSPVFTPAPDLARLTRVQAITPQSNGKILIGGIFASVGGVPRVNIARLNADGSLDASFVPPAEFKSVGPAQVLEITLQSDGNALVSGKLYSVTDAENHATTYGLVRLKNDAGGTNPPPAGEKTSDLQCSITRAKAKAGPAKTLLKGTVTLRNTGKKKVRGVTAAAYLSDDATLDTADTALGNLDLVSAGASMLGKNATSAPVPYRFKLTARTSLTGKYLFVVVDPDDTVEESDETNNVARFGPLP